MDLALVRRTLSGDREAIAEFSERMRCVRRILTAKNVQFGCPLGDSDLEDLIQDTLISVWRKLPDYRGRGSLDGWVYRFAYLELLTCLRRRVRRPASLDESSDSDSALVAPEADASRIEEVYRLLERLGPPDADVLALKHFEDLTFEGIAERMEVSVNTVKSRYYRGLEKLRSMLGVATIWPARKGEV